MPARRAGQIESTSDRGSRLGWTIGIAGSRQAGADRQAGQFWLHDRNLQRRPGEAETSPQQCPAADTLELAAPRQLLPPAPARQGAPTSFSGPKGRQRAQSLVLSGLSRRILVEEGHKAAKFLRRAHQPVVHGAQRAAEPSQT